MPDCRAGNRSVQYRITSYNVCYTKLLRIPNVRIGVHTGEAIIEDEDVFGDVVNVAVRLGSRGKGDEILISGQTAAELEKKEFRLVRKGSFRPRGKARSLTIYRCHWTTHPNLIADIQLRNNFV